MSNDTKYTPEDDEIRQQVAEFVQKLEEQIKLIEHNSQKVANSSSEFESGPRPRIVLVPVENPSAGADDNGGPDRDEDPLH